MVNSLLIFFIPKPVDRIPILLRLDKLKVKLVVCLELKDFEARAAPALTNAPTDIPRMCGVLYPCHNLLP